MTWVSWRLARPSVIGSAVFVTVLAAYLLVTGFHLREVIDSSGLLTCLAHGGSRQTCSDQSLTFYRTLNSLTGGQPVVSYVALLSGVIGVFVGAPLLAREHETGTIRLARTQSVTRGRWFASRVLVSGAVVVVAQSALTLVITYWRGPSDQLDGRFEPTGFDILGIVPLGYAVLAFAVGVTAGGLLRRTLPALGLTLAAWLAVRLVVENVLRGRFIEPLTVSYTDRPPAVLPSGAAGDWVMETKIPKPGSGFPTVYIYQPADRFWTFQLLEFGICVGLAGLALLVGGAVIRRRG
jgi:hypothetical protein